MVNFPVPYTDELVHSLIARARVKLCEVSPKQLLDKVFGSRTVISSVQFPAQASLLARSDAFLSSNEFIYRHTLFPLYGPFIPEARRQLCLEAMKNKSYGQPYLATGFAASRIPWLESLRYCPICMQEQVESGQEPFWQRIHQVVGVDTCSSHRVRLVSAPYVDTTNHRHEYFPANNFLCDEKACPCRNESSELVSSIVAALLNMAEVTSPSYEQWSCFYHDLIQQKKLNKGQYVNYGAVLEAVHDSWEMDWLTKFNLNGLSNQSSWLHCITRKHRKSFSYLEHIVLLRSLLGDDFSIDDLIREVATINENKPVSAFKGNDQNTTSINRVSKLKWIKLVKTYGTKVARKNQGGGLYMKLYRGDRSWLLKINARYRLPIEYENKRVNWHLRDKTNVKILVGVRDQLEAELTAPRQSKQFFINCLPSPSTAEKNLDKLPLTNAFLNRYSETVTEYQFRRLATVSIKHQPDSLPRWKLLRLSGLSDERLTKLAAQFLPKNDWLLG